MIDHMLVDLKKYYEGETPNYVGKKLKMPKGSCYTYTFNLGKGNSLPKDEAKEPQPIRIYDDLWPQDMGYELTPKVIGQLETGNSVFLLIPFYDHIFKHTHCVWIELSEYLQYGGLSSSPLTHLYQGLRHLLDRKVALVND